MSEEELYEKVLILKDLLEENPHLTERVARRLDDEIQQIERENRENYSEGFPRPFETETYERTGKDMETFVKMNDTKGHDVQISKEELDKYIASQTGIPAAKLRHAPNREAAERLVEEENRTLARSAEIEGRQRYSIHTYGRKVAWDSLEFMLKGVVVTVLVCAGIWFISKLADRAMPQVNATGGDGNN